MALAALVSEDDLELLVYLPSLGLEKYTTLFPFNIYLGWLELLLL